MRNIKNFFAKNCSKFFETIFMESLLLHFKKLNAQKITGFLLKHN